MTKLFGTKWPQSAPAAEPGLLARRGPKRGERSPQMGGRGRWCATRARGQHPRARYSPRAGAARHSQSASSAHSRAGCRAGIFSVASSAAAAAAWADPHGEGVPTEEPPLSPLLLPLGWLTASRCALKLRLDASTPCTPSQPCPGRRLSRRPKFGSNFLECAVSCVLPPRPPPPTANPAPCRPGRGPAAFGTQGFPAGRSAGPSRARRDLLRVLRPRCRPDPRRVRTRLNAFGAGAPGGARPLPTGVGVRTLNFRR